MEKKKEEKKRYLEGPTPAVQGVVGYREDSWPIRPRIKLAAFLFSVYTTLHLFNISPLSNLLHAPYNYRVQYYILFWLIYKGKFCLYSWPLSKLYR